MILDRFCPWIKFGSYGKSYYMLYFYISFSGKGLFSTTRHRLIHISFVSVFFTRIIFESFYYKATSLHKCDVLRCTELVEVSLSK
jgi:hypothetical protein